ALLIQIGIGQPEGPFIITSRNGYIIKKGTPGVEEVAHIIRIGDPWGGYDLAPVRVGHITAPHSSQGRGMKLPFQGTHVQPWAPALIITIADTVGINGETGTKIRSLIVTVAPLAKL